ncbi:YqiA/YcfP family alpha/beta fold hydrolase [Sulfurovum sp.]|uniref:YqiA/YcfP family alpha/beta fold hydrolase n=1 Tax=Sulfurovum sp. TaxID=1969726 RepID=UPI0025F58A2C|nr:YqiA/YcfP family alpha/beta fold hydrolase [Sulfurovum sp.]
MIIYIHGFGGSGEGSKAKAFRKYFESIGEDFIAPSLSYVPELAIKTLEELIRSYKKVYLIGSSLGGYYTLYLSHMTEVQKAVLLNPSVKPRETLDRVLGEAPNFFDNSYYQWNKEHLEMLKLYGGKKPPLEKLMLLTQRGDELLDYSQAVEKLQGCKMIIDEGGNHSLEGIERHFETIREFFAIGDYFKHTTNVKGIGLNNNELAVRVVDLYYDSIAMFLGALAAKLEEDAKADEDRGRKKLSDSLYSSAASIKQAAKDMEHAWQVCKAPTMKWMSYNGYNRSADFIEEYVVPEDKRDFSGWKELREVYGHTKFLPYILQCTMYAEEILSTLQANGWEIEKHTITPKMHSKDIGDCDVYWRHYRLVRYVANRDEKYFYFDHEIRTEESEIFIHYGEDTKEFVEDVLQ